MLHPKPPRELAGPRVRQLARLVRERDHIGKLRVRRPARADHAAHVRPVLWIRAAIIALLLESRIGRVPREIVVVARVMIARRAAKIRDAMHEGKMVRLLRKHRQVLAKMDVRRARADRLEFTAKLARRLRLHVPHVNVRRAAAEEKKDRGFRGLARRDRHGIRTEKRHAVQSRKPHRGRAEKRAAIHRRVKKGRTHGVTTGGR